MSETMQQTNGRLGDFQNDCAEGVLTKIARIAGQRPTDHFCTWVGPNGKVAKSLSFGGLWKTAGSIAFKLRRTLNLQKGDRVVLLYSPGVDFFAAFIGCLRAGAVAVPLYPPTLSTLKSNLERIHRIVTRTDASVVLCDNSIRRLYTSDTMNPFSGTRQLWPKVPFVSTSSITAGEQFAEPSIHAQDLAFLQFSSGSTSEPKGVMVSFGSLAHNIHHIHLAYIKRLGWTHKQSSETERERGVSWLPHYHDMGLVCGFLRPLAHGCAMTYFSPVVFIQAPHLWISLISRVKAHWTSSPNFGLALTARKWTPNKHAQHDTDLSSLIFIQCAAEPILPQAVQAFHSAFAPYGLRRHYLAASYGLAESVVMVCADLSGEVATSRARPGLVRCGFDHHPDFDIRIVDSETCTEVASGEEGEIWVHSASTARGYWQLPDETAATFGATLAGEEARKGYLRTGDLGFVEDGGLFVSGRIKDLIILRGQNLYPQDIEACVEQASGQVRPGCVAALAASAEDSSPALVVVMEVRAEVKASELSSVCASVARDVAMRFGLLPKVVAIKAKSIPKTSSGKIRRRQTGSDLVNGLLSVRHVMEREEGDVAVEAVSAETGFIHDHGGSEPTASERQGIVCTTDREAVAMSEEELQELVRLEVGTVSELEFDLDSPLMEHGLDSVGAMWLVRSLQARCGVDLDSLALFEFPTIRALAGHLHALLHPERHQPTTAISCVDAHHRHHSLAIVGLALRLPGGVCSLSGLARMLQAGRTAGDDVPMERWDRHAVQAEVLCGLGCTPDVAQRMSRAAFAAGSFRLFDAAFFHLTPLEADDMDPQQRELLMVAAEALVDAGLDIASLRHRRVAVIVACSGLSLFGASGSATRSALDQYIRPGSGPRVYESTRAALSATSGRISHCLGLRGPSVTVDTACSSSLVAVDMAKRYVLADDCDAALVCAVNQIQSPAVSMALAEAGMTSVDGQCHTFDATANGYGRGEGCCAIVIKKEELKTGDDAGVYAILRGSAVGHDGESASLSAPNARAQVDTIQRALSDAGVSPTDVQYLEAHGTGTVLGDPVEMGSAVSVFAGGRELDRPLMVNSVKANIGHLEAAAGLAGLLSAVSVLTSGIVHPNAQLTQLNPLIADQQGSSNLQFPAAVTPLRDQHEALASVSSFGFTGTLSHVVLQAPPQTNRRCALKSRGVVWLFSGQDGMAPRLPRRLLDVEAYAKTLQRCDVAVAHELGLSMRTLLHPATRNDRQSTRKLLAEPKYAQSAHFALQVAMAHAWLSLGYQPEVVIGHSLGELAGLCIAGAFSVEQGAWLVLGRARAVQDCLGTRGKMVVIRSSAEEVERAVTSSKVSGASVAAVNGPSMVVLSGSEEDVIAVLAEMPSSVARKDLAGGIAYHSPLMHGAVVGYQRTIRESLSRFQPTDCDVVSTVTGVRCDSAVDPVTYLTDNLCQPVRFHAAIETVLGEGFRRFVEMGPRDPLTRLTRAVAEGVSCVRGVDCTPQHLAEMAVQERMLQLPFKPQAFEAHKLQHRILQTQTVLASGEEWYRGWLHDQIPLRWHTEAAQHFRELAPSFQLETLLAAAAKGNHCASFVQLNNISFGNMRIGGDTATKVAACVTGRSVTVTLEPEGFSAETCEAEISTFCESGQWTELEKAHGIAVDDSTGWEVKDVESLITVEEQQIVQAVVDELRLSQGGDATTVLATIVMDSLRTEEEECRAYLCHPAMLESILSCVTAACRLMIGDTNNKTELRPVSIATATHKRTNTGNQLRCRCEATVIVHAVHAGRELHATCTVADPAGNMFLVLNQILVESCESPVSVVPGVLTLEKLWEPIGRASVTGQGPELVFKRVLAISPHGGVSMELGPMLEEVVIVPCDITAVESELTAKQDFDCVLLISSGDTQDDKIAMARATEMLNLTISVLELCFSKQMSLVVVTHGCIVADSRQMTPEPKTKLWMLQSFPAMLWGIVRGARPEASSRSKLITIDADPAVDPSTAFVSAFKKFLWSCQSNPAGTLADAEFLHREDALMVGRYRSARGTEVVPSETFETAGAGCFLVTGGTGRVGLMIARALVEELGVRCLVLLSRSGKAASKGCDDLRWLEEQATLELHIIQCDVGDEASVVDALDTIRSLGKPLRGVVHAAGVLRLGRVAAHEAQACVDDVMHSHVTGCWLLHTHTQADPLSLFVAVSSVASAFSVLGCSVYSAAKSFQDSLMAFRARTGLPSYSMQLPTISGAGLADGLSLPQAFQSPAAQMSPADCVVLLRSRLRSAFFNLAPPVELFAPEGLISAMSSVLPPVCVVQFAHLQQSPTPRAHNRRHARMSRDPAVDANLDGVSSMSDAELTFAVLSVARETMGLPDLDAHESLLKRGLDSLNAVAMVERLRMDVPGFHCNVADLLNHGTVDELVKQVRGDAAVAPAVRAGLSASTTEAVVTTQSQTQTDDLPPYWMRMCRQMLVLVAVLGSIFMSAVPSILVVESQFDSASQWWLINGRGGPALLAVVPLWMASFSLLCLLAKWALIGRYRQRALRIWDVSFTAWMVVERLFGFWEFAVGRFLVGSPWLNLFYIVLGARVAWNARIDSFFREWDLVSIGSKTTLKGRLYARIFSSSSVEFGAITVGDTAHVGTLAVVQAFSSIDDGVIVDAATVVPPRSTLTKGGPWHGCPCRQRERDSFDDISDCEPWMLTRLSVPLVFAACSLSLASCFSAILPEMGTDPEPWSFDSVLRSASYVVVFLWSGVGMFVITVLLKWSFLSPFLTDAMSTLVVTTFFPYIEKTHCIAWWHRAFGLNLGKDSIVMYSDFCPASTAHTVELGDRTYAARTTLAPNNAPTVWSWLCGVTGHPWQAQKKDISIGSDVMLYLFSRIESNVTIEDQAQVASSSRVFHGSTVSVGSQAIGDPCIISPGHDESMHNAPIHVPRFLIFVNYCALILHLVVVIGFVVVSAEATLSIQLPGLPAERVLTIVGRIASFVGILLLFLALETLVVKWMFTGRAKPTEQSLFNHRDHLYTFPVHAAFQKLLVSLFGGLFVMELYMQCLGVHVGVGSAFINTALFFSHDADLVTIEDGAVVDDGAYILAHASARDRLLVSGCRIGARGVLHPSASLVRGRMHADSELFPRSRTYGPAHIGEGEAWIGSPAYPMKAGFVL